MLINIEDVGGLERKLTDLNEQEKSNAAATRGALQEIGDDLDAIRFEQERLRFLLNQAITLRRSSHEVCVVCGRILFDHTSSRQPRLCEKHLLHEYGCPECIKDSRGHAMKWSPKKHRATCGRCKTSLTGRQLEKLIYDYWRKRYED